MKILNYMLMIKEKIIKWLYRIAMISCIVMFCSAGAPIIAGEVAPVLDPASAISKSIIDYSKTDPTNTITYIALMTAMASIGLSGYLIKRMLDDNKSQIISINALTEEMRKQHEENKIRYEEKLAKQDQLTMDLVKKPCVLQDIGGENITKIIEVLKKHK